jgi:hypothetical protein
VNVAKMGVESMVLHTGVKLLCRIGQDARRRVLAYWCACAESLPLTDGNSKVLDEHPVETEPPMIKFIHERREAEAAQPDA